MLVKNVANLTHEKFIEIYQKINNGTRIKITIDQNWVKKHGTDQADLAKLNYFELPQDWQHERWLGAKTALDTLYQWVNSGNLLDEKFIEHASKIIHDEWLGSNLNRAEDEHKLSYKQLTEEAKEKDRIFARSAVEIYQKEKPRL